MRAHESPDASASANARTEQGVVTTDTDTDDIWMSWAEAAALVGCPVPTIDWYSRAGRIEKRPFRGNRPSLRRSSVEDFATWWRQRQTERAERRRRRPRASRSAAGAQPDRGRARTRGPANSPPEGYVPTADAAAQLGVSQSHVSYLIATRRLDGVRDGQRWWLPHSSVEALQRDRHAWVSFASAAHVIGCATSTVHLAVQAGQIEQRAVPRSLPSLSRASVLEFAQRRHEEQQRRTEAQQKREAERSVAPPDSTHQWLRSREVARVLDLSRSRVDQLARAGRIPCRTVGRRRWFRADHIEMVRASREFAARAAGRPA